MKTEWKAFLTNKGAEFSDDASISFGNTVRETRIVYTGNVIADLSHYALLSVHGEDAVNLLQGQLTNNVAELAENHSQLNSLCTQKGRVLSTLRLFKRNDAIYIQLPAGMAEETLKILRMYVLRSKVNLENASDNFVSIGLSGPTADKELEVVSLPAPKNVDDVVQSDDYTIIRIHGIHPRFIIFSDLESIKKLWTELDVHSAPVGTGPWQLLDILAGIPIVTINTSQSFVPQMINLQLLNGISFKKGCYTGQEIVARMQYLGKLKKRMFLASIKSDVKPVPGDKLFAKEFSETQNCGSVINSEEGADGSYDTLCVADIKTQENSPIHYKTSDGPQLNFRELPYPLEPVAIEKIS